MSIQTEIIRLKNAKADIAAAISAYDIEVPETTTLDGYADLVRQISDKEIVVVQADWAENDESAVGYVKNRTHCVDYAKVLDNSTEHFTAYDDGTYGSDNAWDFTFDAGDRVRVV